jgi:hypothetical protein
VTLEEAAKQCERAWSFYAIKHGIRRELDASFLLKSQEELGELTSYFLEMGGNEHKSLTDDKLRHKFAGDCASLVGNALILARHFNVDLSSVIPEKFPVGE